MKLDNDNLSIGKITIGDVADALGVSKTTVSRAISGKGRIGAETRERVMRYIEENGYKPNVIAKGLAQSKTFNIGWLVPGEYDLVDLPFFQRCLKGVIEVASKEDYDIIISMVTNRDISQLERLISNNKVDGVILSRTWEHDLSAEYLKKKQIPFVVIGALDDKEVIQIDNDHQSACKELTGTLLQKGMRRIGLIGGSSELMVTKRREIGYRNAFAEQDIPVDEAIMIGDCDSDEKIRGAVQKLLKEKAECILCMDDSICLVVLDELKENGISVPADVKVASFYNSTVLAKNNPAITSLQFNAKEIGRAACQTLLDYLDGNEINRCTLLGYEVKLMDSTN